MTISNYESYQTELHKFWDKVNSIINDLSYLPIHELREASSDIAEKINTISNLVPILEKAKTTYKRNNDGDIAFREIFFSIPEETKQKIGTATLDEKNIKFSYPI